MAADSRLRPRGHLNRRVKQVLNKISLPSKGGNTCGIHPCVKNMCSDQICCTVGWKKKRAFFTSKMDLERRKKLVKCYIWSIALYGAETGTLRAVDQKCGAGKDGEDQLDRSCEK
jgi:hypothetical protein